MSTTKKGYALKTFTDAGPEKAYEGGKVHEFTTGEFGNFEAAGLVRKPTNEELKASEPATAGKTGA